jgi:hypothetical protein
MEWQLDNWPRTVNNQKYGKQRRFIQMNRKDDKMFRVCSATYDIARSYLLETEAGSVKNKRIDASL